MIYVQTEPTRFPDEARPATTNRIIASLIAVRFPEFVENNIPSKSVADACAAQMLTMYGDVTTVTRDELSEALRHAAMLFREGELVEESPEITAQYRKLVKADNNTRKQRI